MNRNTSAVFPAKAICKVVALLLLAVCCLFSSPAFKKRVSFAKSEPTTVQKQSHETGPDLWMASEPIDASNGIVHEAEISLLPLVFVFLALFFFPVLQLRKAAYTSAPPKIFEFYRILPNAP